MYPLIGIRTMEKSGLSKQHGRKARSCRRKRSWAPGLTLCDNPVDHRMPVADTCDLWCARATSLRVSKLFDMPRFKPQGCELPPTAPEAGHCPRSCHHRKRAVSSSRSGPPKSDTFQSLRQNRRAQAAARLPGGPRSGAAARAISRGTTGHRAWISSWHAMKFR